MKFKVGDFVRSDNGMVEGFVDGVFEVNRVRVLKFNTTENATKNGEPDVVVVELDAENLKVITKEDIHRKKFPFYFSLDYQWRCSDRFLPTFDPKKVQISTQMLVFYPVYQSASSGFFDLAKIEELFYDERNWRSIESVQPRAQGLLWMRSGESEFMLSSDSWRLKPVLQEYLIHLFTEGNRISLDRLTIRPKSPRKKHNCTPLCMADIIKRQRATFSRKFEDNIPIQIPFRFGFRRELEYPSESTKKPTVVYKAPCGKELRNLGDLELFFIDTKTQPRDLGYVNFDFQSAKLQKKLVITKGEEEVVYPDLSGGRENFCIPVVAEKVNNRKVRPPKILYPRVSSLPIPKYVSDEEYKNFMVSCQCKDGCQPQTCACMNLTHEGYELSRDFKALTRPLRTKRDNGLISEAEFQVQYSRVKQNCGYRHGLIQRDSEADNEIFDKNFKQNKSVTTSGIYECHSGCACRNGWCNNRVVQNGIKAALVAFRTEFCGWGIRAAVDIKPGTYLGDYFGELLFELAMIPWDKNQFYQSDTAANLNFIEIAEGYKAETKKPEDEGFDDITTKFSETRILLHNYHGGVIMPNNERYDELNPTTRMYAVPFVDASIEGNLGRFFNHSCGPNIGIQNVFTEHQDLRFPHTSFFTMRNIKAGEELRWDYGYVNNKTQACHCGTSACNGYYK